MAYILDASVTFKGDFGKRANNEKPTKWPGITWAELLDGDFKLALSAWTDCNIKTITERYTFALDTAAPGADANVDKVLTVRLRNTTTGKIVSVSIPAPTAARLVKAPEGEKLDPNQVNAFMVMINDNLEDTFSYLYSIVEQSR